MDLGLLHYDIFNSIGYKPLQIMAVFFDPEVEGAGDVSVVLCDVYDVLVLIGYGTVLYSLCCVV